MWWILVSWALAAEPSRVCDPGVRLDEALVALKAFDVGAAKTSLQQAEADFGCSSRVTRPLLARHLVVDGLFWFVQGDPTSAQTSFASAKALDPSVWIDDFGAETRAVYDQAQVQPGAGGLVSENPVGPGFSVAVDGESVKLPADVPAGLHLVQVLDSEDHAWFAQLALIGPGETVQIAPVLPAKAPAPPAKLELAAHVGVLGDLVAGTSYDLAGPDGAIRQPSLQVALPVEAGLSLFYGPGWWRLQVEASPLLNGRYVYGDAQDPQGTALAWGGSLAVGATAGPVRIGLLVGLWLPSRVRARVVAAVPLGSTGLALEARAGINLPDRQPVEPAATLGLSWRSPSLRRR